MAITPPCGRKKQPNVAEVTTLRPTTAKAGTMYLESRLQQTLHTGQENLRRLEINLRGRLGIY